MALHKVARTSFQKLSCGTVHAPKFSSLTTSNTVKVLLQLFLKRSEVTAQCMLKADPCEKLNMTTI